MLLLKVILEVEGKTGKCGWLLEASKKAPCQPSLERKAVISQLSIVFLSWLWAITSSPHCRLWAMKTHKQGKDGRIGPTLYSLSPSTPLPGNSHHGSLSASHHHHFLKDWKPTCQSQGSQRKYAPESIRYLPKAVLKTPSLLHWRLSFIFNRCSSIATWPLVPLSTK